MDMIHKMLPCNEHALYRDSGCKYQGKIYGPRYAHGDRIGCGMIKGHVYFTKNGRFLGNVSGIVLSQF
jgi:hypothetical protein